MVVMTSRGVAAMAGFRGIRSSSSACRLLVVLCCVVFAAAASSKPNVVIFFADDLGYGDLGCYGRHNVHTPNLDALAQEGVKFTQCLTAEAICTPSRASLLTGQYAVKLGMSCTHENFRALNTVASPGGLPDVPTLASMLSQEYGYGTKIVGKWHLGSGSHLPTHRGFDSFYGMPVTNVQSCGWDMGARPVYYPRSKHSFMVYRVKSALLAFAIALPALYLLGLLNSKKRVALYLLAVATFYSAAYYYSFTYTLLSPQHCILMRDDTIVEQPVKLENLTLRFTKEANQYIEQQVAADQPFFLYMSYVKVHTALFTSKPFVNVSAGGAYGDNVEELDWSVGAILHTLEEQGVLDNTLVFFSSDNGPFLERGVEAGSTGGLRGGKAQVWEGGIRVPGLLRYPPLHWVNGIVYTGPVSLLDIVPTVMDVLGSETDRSQLDGTSWVQLLSSTAAAAATTTEQQQEEGEGEGESTSPRILYHYCNNILAGVRWGKYKGVFEAPIFEDERSSSCPEQTVCPCKGVSHAIPLLFNMDADPNETTPLTNVTEPDYDRIVETMIRLKEEQIANVKFPPSELDYLPRPWLQPCCTPGADADAATRSTGSRCSCSESVTDLPTPSPHQQVWHQHQQE